MNDEQFIEYGETQAVPDGARTTVDFGKNIILIETELPSVAENSESRHASVQSDAPKSSVNVSPSAAVNVEP